MTPPRALDMSLVWALARGAVRDADSVRAAVAGRAFFAAFFTAFLVAFFAAA